MLLAAFACPPPFAADRYAMSASLPADHSPRRFSPSLSFVTIMPRRLLAITRRRQRLAPLMLMSAPTFMLPASAEHSAADADPALPMSAAFDGRQSASDAAFRFSLCRLLTPFFFAFIFFFQLSPSIFAIQYFHFQLSLVSFRL